MSKVSIGLQAEITMSANGKEFIGVIDKISDVGTYSANGSTFEAMIKFTNDGSVKLGMSAEGKIILERAENAVLVPKEAIQTSGDSSYVIVINDDGKSQNTPVEVGISNDVYTQIKSGISEGKTVQYTTSSQTSTNSFRGIEIPSGMNMREGGSSNSGTFEMRSVER